MIVGYAAMEYGKRPDGCIGQTPLPAPSSGLEPDGRSMVVSLWVPRTPSTQLIHEGAPFVKAASSGGDCGTWTIAALDLSADARHLRGGAKAGRASKEAVYLVSRSRTRNLTGFARSASSIERFRACWVTQLATGLDLMPAIRTRRLSWWMNTSTWSLRRRTVSRWKKSQAINPFSWAARNSAQVGPDLGGDRSIPWRFRVAQRLEGR